jgi:hypothetical protein
MGGPEKKNPRGGIVNAAKMALVGFTAVGSPKRFFYNDASEAVGNK